MQIEPSFRYWMIFAVSTPIGGCDPELHVRVNELQVIGTHNSYHIEPEPDLLAAINNFSPALAQSLEYTHRPFAEQLERGARQLELDVFADPEGGRYASRAGLIALGRDPNSGLPELQEPGLKVLHVQDLDFQTHCLRFVDCLSQLKVWSDANPKHLPILVLVEAKEDVIPDPLQLGFVEPLPFDAALLDGIDTEIRSVFPTRQLITPDDVRGSRPTLEEAVLQRGWPRLYETRGKFFFALINRGATRDLYVQDHASLAGRVMFVNSDRGRPEAAFFNRDDPLQARDEIRELVRAGYLVRTRADIDTLDARAGSYERQTVAFESGAQFISTDYLVPDPDFATGYLTTLPGGQIARCNPVIAPRDCASSRLAAVESLQRRDR